jgi:signal peptidase I
MAGIWALKLLSALGLFMAARSSLADQYLVPTGSMEPTILPGDRIFVDKLAYDLRAPFGSAVLLRRHEPARGDLVIFLDPRDKDTTFVKRVVALPGESVMMRGGTLFVDGEPQRLSMRADGRFTERLGAVVHAAGTRDPESFGPVIVPEGQLFVMGDNRLVSYDSRFLGAIPRELVRGKVVGVVYRYDDDAGGFDAARLIRGLD